MTYSNDKVLETALSAMMTAGVQYEKWTKGNYAPWQAPEYVYTTSIAKSVAGLPFKPGVYCEFNSAKAISWANKEEFGRKLAKLTRKSRSDILVTNANDDFKYLIEVKRRVWTKNVLKNDMVRIPDLIGPKKASTISSGASVFFICYSGKTEKDARDSLDSFLTENRKNLTDLKKYRANAWLIRGAREYLKRRKFNVKLRPGPIVRKYVSEVDGEKCVWAWTACALEVKPTP